MSKLFPDDFFKQAMLKPVNPTEPHSYNTSAVPQELSICEEE